MWANRLVQDYEGGQWTFYQTDAGGWFVAPPCPDGQTLCVEATGMQVMVYCGSQAAGVALCIYATNHVLELLVDNNLGDSEAAKHLYENAGHLRDIACALGEDEASAVFTIID